MSSAVARGPAAIADMPAPPRPSVDKTKTSTGKTKPAFTLQGSRAWHNPQPFSQTHAPQANKYAPQMDQPISTFSRGQAMPQENRFASYLQPQVGMPRATPRFGPNTASEMPEPSPIPLPQVSGQRPASSTEYKRPGFSNAVQRQDENPNQESFLREAPYTGTPETLVAGDSGEGAGILEIQQDGYGFLRAGNLLPGKNDVYISGTQIRRFRLRNGDSAAVPDGLDLSSREGRGDGVGALVEADFDLPGDEVRVDDRSSALFRVNDRADFRRDPDEVFVGLLLVLETAHQPAAAA